MRDLWCRCCLQVPGTLQVLLERLRNEVTRLSAVKGFHVIASSTLALPLGAVLAPVVVRKREGGILQPGG